MSKINNVVFATTTNGNESNNNNNNVEMNNPQVEKMESVEVSSPSGESVEVSSQYESEVIRRNRMYWGHSHSSRKRDRIVIVTNREFSRGAKMITYVVIEPNDVVGYDEKYNAICSYKLNQYRKSAKTYGDPDTYYWEIVEGANGVYGGDEITIEDIKNSRDFNYGVLPMDEDTYKKWGEWINAMTSVYGLKAIMVGRDTVDGIVYDKRGNRIETVVNEDITAVMTAYAVESGDDNNDTKNAIDYFTEKMSNAQEEADVALTRKMICLRGNGLANDPEWLKELDNDYSAALGRYYMYKKYVEILAKTNETEELQF